MVGRQPHPPCVILAAADVVAVWVPIITGGIAAAGAVVVAYLGSKHPNRVVSELLRALQESAQREAEGAQREATLERKLAAAEKAESELRGAIHVLRAQLKHQDADER